MSENPTITFHGAAGTVTGSKYLIKAGGRQILLEAGLFQGLKELRLRNWAEPPFDAAAIDAVVLSHAHIDHSGYLPILVRNGFHGKVFCSPGTEDLLTILLPDAARLQEEEANFANQQGYSKHKPALPLFTEDDATAVLRRIEPEPYGEWFQVNAPVRACFHHAGHILGASIVELEISRTGGIHKLVFSGDLGRWNRPILRDPEVLTEADTIMIESTYGDREHPEGGAELLARMITEIYEKKSALVIPSFAVDRAQEILYVIRGLEEAGKIPVVPVYLDSPMAINATAIYGRHPEDHDVEMTKLMYRDGSPLATKKFAIARSQAESIHLNKIKGPIVILSASGMATGGRVLHHLERRLPDPDNVVLFAGFQAKGTRGRLLEEGASTMKIHGNEVPVKAKVERLEGFSAHADQKEILKWLSAFKRPPSMVYVVHGEPESASVLAGQIRERLKWNVHIAGDGETRELV